MEIQVQVEQLYEDQPHSYPGQCQNGFVQQVFFSFYSHIVQSHNFAVNKGKFGIHISFNLLIYREWPLYYNNSAMSSTFTMLKMSKFSYVIISLFHIYEYDITGL